MFKLGHFAARHFKARLFTARQGQQDTPPRKPSGGSGGGGIETYQFTPYQSADEIAELEAIAHENEFFLLFQ